MFPLSVQYPQQDGDTALHLAAIDKPDVSNHVTCVKVLLSQPGIDPFIKNKKGKTPLDGAAMGVTVIYQNMRDRIESFPVHEYVKVVVCGHSGAGKSTLTQVGYALCTMGSFIFP